LLSKLNLVTAYCVAFSQDDGMMELVLRDLAELRAPWVDVTARRGVVTRMYRSYLFLRPQDASGWARADGTSSSAHYLD
jgi:hypothetical protein